MKDKTEFGRCVRAYRGVAFLLSIFFSGLAVAGIDCGKATSSAEKAICSSEALSSLDSELAQVYGLALSDLPPGKRPEKVQEQKDWLINVRDKCDSSDCLTRAYRDRIQALASLDGGVAYVVDAKERAVATNQLKQDVHNAGFPGDIDSCQRIVRIVAGAGRDQSFGAICSTNGRLIMACNDLMIGRLTVKFYGFAVNGPDLAYFVSANCPAGG